ncbi:Protein CBG13877 [Caenorhabditis briggsae]|uniref:Protein CBG13877 n=1 Tax=Caenorhabditis briggsae TaxID=6238 RepID=A8XJ51_CAEBR|nr:Protein CBG13877 [Caenorhabditis briggsae]CAP32676.1 Protein CBG13877 [Caenorhabditis briggsae]
MARLQKEPDLTFFYVLKRFIIFLINPLWFTITCVFEFYTYLRPFRLCHFMFWHCIIWIAASHLYVVGQNSETVYLGFDSLAFFILLIIGVAPWAKVLLQVRKPKVQNLNHVILGFFGMISLHWIVFGCFLGMSFNFYYARYWPACSMLLLSSFVFSINAWSCFFTPSYHLCEHRRNEWDMHDEPFDGIIRHVAVRRNLGKMKDPMNLPTGFQFDDQLDVSKLQYRTHRSFMY